MIDTDASKLNRLISKYEGITRFDLVANLNEDELAILLLDQFAEVKDLKRQLSCMIKSYDSIIDAVREFIETDYCSHDGAEWLRYNIGIEEEESE